MGGTKVHLCARADRHLWRRASTETTATNMLKKPRQHTCKFCLAAVENSKAAKTNVTYFKSTDLCLRLAFKKRTFIFTVKECLNHVYHVDAAC